MGTTNGTPSILIFQFTYGRKESHSKKVIEPHWNCCDGCVILFHFQLSALDTTPCSLRICISPRCPRQTSLVIGEGGNVNIMEPLLASHHESPTVSARAADNWSHPGQNSRHFAYDIFQWIFMNEKFCILTRFSLKFIPKGLGHFGGDDLIWMAMRPGQYVSVCCYHAR